MRSPSAADTTRPLARPRPAHSRLTGIKILVRGFDNLFDPFSSHLRFFSKRSLVRLLGEMGYDVRSIRRDISTSSSRMSVRAKPAAVPVGETALRTTGSCTHRSSAIEAAGRSTLASAFAVIHRPKCLPGGGKAMAL